MNINSDIIQLHTSLYWI